MTQHQLLKEFGRILQGLRFKLDITQERVAEKSDLDRTYISQLERGKKNPSLITILKLSEALHVPAEYILRSLAKVQSFAK